MNRQWVDGAWPKANRTHKAPETTTNALPLP